MRKRLGVDISPTQLGVKGVDLKAIATTQYTSGVLDLSGYETVEVLLSVDNTGAGATGLATLKAQRCDRAGTAVGPEVTLATGIDTKADTEASVTVGHGQAADVKDGTIHADADNFRPSGLWKVIVEVEEANNGTTSVGSLRIRAS